MACPCHNEIIQAKQVAFCSSHAFASLFLLLSLFSPAFAFSLQFLCSSFTFPVWATLVLQPPSPLLSLPCSSTPSTVTPFSLQLLCAPDIFYLPLPLSSFHPFFHTPCPVAFSCILFLFFHLWCTVFVFWPYLIWAFCILYTVTPFQAAHTLYPETLIPWNHFLFIVSLVVVGKMSVYGVSCLEGRNEHTPHLRKGMGRRGTAISRLIFQTAWISVEEE